jgi:hypothetical protein
MLGFSLPVAAWVSATPRALLLGDQFEELYTLCPAPATRQAFLDLLLAAVTAAANQATSAATRRRLRSCTAFRRRDSKRCCNGSRCWA